MIYTGITSVAEDQLQTLHHRLQVSAPVCLTAMYIA